MTLQKLVVRVTINDGLGSIELVEELEIQTGTIAEATNLLEQFHGLIERIRDEQAGIPAKK